MAEECINITISISPLFAVDNHLLSAYINNNQSSDLYSVLRIYNLFCLPQPHEENCIVSMSPTFVEKTVILRACDLLRGAQLSTVPVVM